MVMDDLGWNPRPLSKGSVKLSRKGNVWLSGDVGFWDPSTKRGKRDYARVVVVYLPNLKNPASGHQFSTKQLPYQISLLTFYSHSTHLYPFSYNPSKKQPPIRLRIISQHIFIMSFHNPSP